MSAAKSMNPQAKVPKPAKQRNLEALTKYNYVCAALLNEKVARNPGILKCSGAATSFTHSQTRVHSVKIESIIVIHPTRDLPANSQCRLVVHAQLDEAQPGLCMCSIFWG
jgi:hypothetical protein